MDPSVWEAVTSAVDAADPPSAETDPTHWDNSTGSEPVWGADGSVVPRSPVKSFTRREAHQKSPFPRGTQSDSTTNFFVMKEEDSGCDAWSETLDADWGQAAEVERAADASWPVESKTQYAECEEDTFTTWSDLWQEKESKVVSSNIQTSLFDRRRVAVPQNTQRSWELPELPVIWNEHPTAPPSERTFAKGTHPGYGPLPELCRGSDEGKHGFCRRPSTLHRLKRAYKNLHKRR
ncbi:MAG: uncharacterized protein KVP18_001870 [Porospora cf. gigantea A]|uniref:uncharacterized protein n=1 Tax=Porospora cf. gigantea A TaxID=2853593 RepID=UPI00355AB383|nr:MAG: hypothetical protein KVP18_001870 [Porospora cf. gigantea A]